MNEPLAPIALPTELLRVALEHLGEGVAVIDGEDPDHPIVWVNPAFERMSGFALAELAGNSLRVLQGGDLEQPAVAELGEAMRAGQDCTVLLRSYRPDGALYQNATRVVLTRDEAGRSWWLVFSRDISAQHEMEITLGRRSDELEAVQRRLVDADPIDRLTGLQSERSFEMALELSWFSCARDRRPLALFLFSPDYFDVYLETFGRIAGDSCLRMVARGVGAAFRRASDVSARLGETEFAALGTDMDQGMLESHARRVCDRVRSLAIRNPHAPLGRVLTVSAVVLLVRPGQAPDWRRLLEDARSTLAAAKAGGVEQLVVRDYGVGGD